MKSIDLLYPQIENDNSVEIAETETGENNKLVEELSKTISTVVENQSIQTKEIVDALKQTITDISKNKEIINETKNEKGEE